MLSREPHLEVTWLKSIFLFCICTWKEHSQEKASLEPTVQGKIIRSPPPRFNKRNTSDLDCTCNRSNLFSSCKYVLKIICPIYKTEQIHITVRSVRQREGKDTPRRSEEQPAEKCVRSELMRQQT